LIIKAVRPQILDWYEVAGLEQRSGRLNTTYRHTARLRMLAQLFNVLIRKTRDRIYAPGKTCAWVIRCGLTRELRAS
jgi:hypothetical protein